MNVRLVLVRGAVLVSTCILAVPRMPLSSQKTSTLPPALEQPTNTFIRNSEKVFLRISMNTNEVEPARFGREEALRAGGKVARKNLLASLLANGCEGVMTFGLMQLEQACIREDTTASILFAHMSMVGGVVCFKVGSASERCRAVFRRIASWRQRAYQRSGGHDRAIRTLRACCLRCRLMRDRMRY